MPADGHGRSPLLFQSFFVVFVLICHRAVMQSLGRIEACAVKASGASQNAPYNVFTGCGWRRRLSN